jgi:sec-independent protein translocase protein TatA
MGGLSFSHILILMVVFLLVFGAKRIPEIGASLGKGIKEFKKSLSDVDDKPEALPPPTGSASHRPDQTAGGPKRLNQ